MSFPLARRFFARLTVPALALGMAALPLAAPAAPAAPKPPGDDGTTVRVSGGPVRGTVEDGLRVFQGIPYAAPPVGDLRFERPQPVKPWRGTLDATAPRSQCAQLGNGTGNPTTFVEDCLYLNVTTPAGRSARRAGLPVMVWIHGGSFLTGDGASYDAGKLATRGDVVVVTINYRLGPFGFLNHPDLGTSNAALLDQQAALRWVQRNARAFGGNPRNVTVFGESAGSASVCANIASPQARGLFRRAIAQSYSCTADFATLASSQAAAETYSAAVGCAEDTAACLRRTDPETLLRAWTSGAFAVGGAALPRQPGQALADGTANRVDLMHGNTLDENRLFIPLQYGTALTAAQYVGAIRATFGPAADAVLARYPLDAYASPIIALSTVFSDYGSPLSTCSHVDAYDTAQDRTRVYAYQFQDRTADPLVPLLGTANGAAHATELPYLFPGLFGDGLDPEQEKLSDAMVSYWTSFARHGRPSGRGLPRWPEYDGAGDVLALDLQSAGGIRAEDVAAAANCSFWRQLG
ncbi:carboxylesterase/lipase family protein [Nocardioides campestrisoli]|uniref:carboxylesterase/lipase family protein n=1 Tax=Nocardioides campestrisoli TaxID=2736757 RepID=UPI00163D7FB0|nr:carboxylesterase family protein [Nocardioides campestrisoli]